MVISVTWCREECHWRCYPSGLGCTDNKRGRGGSIKLSCTSQTASQTNLVSKNKRGRGGSIKLSCTSQTASQTNLVCKKCFAHGICTLHIHSNFICESVVVHYMCITHLIFVLLQPKLKKKRNKTCFLFLNSEELSFCCENDHEHIDDAFLYFLQKAARLEYLDLQAVINVSTVDSVCRMQQQYQIVIWCVSRENRL